MANWFTDKCRLIKISSLIAIGILISITPVYSQQGTIFSDQFYMGSYDWTPVYGDWEVMDGELVESNDPGSYTAWATAGAVSWTDYAVEAKVRSTDKDGKILIAGRWIDENNHYAMEYSSTDAGADSAQIILYKKFNGARVNLLSLNRSTNPNVPYIGDGAEAIPGNQVPVTLKFSLYGSTIKLFTKDAEGNDILLGTTADTSITYGKIALGEFNRVAYFDDIMVWDITPPTIDAANINVLTTGSTCSIIFKTSELASARIDYGPSDGDYTMFKERTTRTIDHRLDLTGLETSTTYKYKITVTDAAGNQTVLVPTFSTFTTMETVDSTEPVISNVVYNDVYSNSIVINWNTDEEANSTIEYGTSPGAYTYALSYSDYVTNHSVRLNGLIGSTGYYFRVKSRDVTGNVGVSAECFVQTLKDLKPRITKVDAGETPSVYVTVYWEKVPDVNYNVYFSTSNVWGTPESGIQTVGNLYTFTKSSLTANTNYFIKVEAVDGEDSDFTIVRAFPPDKNPHGYYMDNPELCANCHYTHKAPGPSLVAAITGDYLCLTCHDGTQSKYDVINGTYKGADNNFYPSIAGPYGNLWDTTSYTGEKEVTSKHDLNIYNYSAPGSNIENLDVADAHLACSSCHDPHGSENYRILRKDMMCSLDPTTPELDVEAYTVTEATKESTIYVKGAVEFCGSCHSDFNQGTQSGQRAATTTQQPGFTLSAASTHMYMHAVNVDAAFVNEENITMTPPAQLPYEGGKIICQTCHFTHGTTNGGTHVRRDGVPSTSLKRFDETEGCEWCHQKTNYPE